MSFVPFIAHTLTELILELWGDCGWLLEFPHKRFQLTILLCPCPSGARRGQGLVPHLHSMDTGTPKCVSGLVWNRVAHWEGSWECLKTRCRVSDVSSVPLNKAPLHNAQILLYQKLPLLSWLFV